MQNALGYLECESCRQDTGSTEVLPPAVTLVEWETLGHLKWPQVCLQLNWPTLYAEKENEWCIRTSQASAPPFMVTLAAATAWGCTRAQGKTFGHLCPVVTSCCRLSSARQKVLPRGTSAVAANCRHCCRAPIAVTTLCSLSCKVTELCLKSRQVALPLLN